MTHRSDQTPSPFEPTEENRACTRRSRSRRGQRCCTSRASRSIRSRSRHKVPSSGGGTPCTRPTPASSSPARRARSRRARRRSPPSPRHSERAGRSAGAERFPGGAKNSRADGVADDYREPKHDSQHREEAPRRSSGLQPPLRFRRLRWLDHARGVSREIPFVASGLAMKSASSS